ncbi:MAG: pyruvate dehydrogenase, partial [Bdellovibrionales bacterium]|nr:pyruvate dehydrogenase [Bdellovibrionales bacterium]
MTVYDFFVKRALDQYFYDLYWKSSFILVGTPSGVTLSPEGAQHGWKSDFQIPNQITWEPFYCVELDWIMADAIHRHLTYTNEGRTGVLIRGVTKGIDQKQFLKLLKTQARFKSEPVDNLCHKDFMLDGGVSEDQIACVSDEQILGEIQQDVLKGAYFLINYKNYKGYIPGENVIHIFAMGALVDEAIKASEKLLQEGIYANVVSVTSPDLLIGNLAQENDYEYLKHDLGVSDKLHITSEDFSNIADMVSISGRRVPIVSTHDGEPGLLDNIGSIVGVKHEALAVRKHSKCGRPADVYKYHGIDQDGIVSAAKKVLAETALEGINVSSYLLAQAAEKPSSIGSWKDLV